MKTLVMFVLAALLCDLLVGTLWGATSSWEEVLKSVRFKEAAEKSNADVSRNLICWKGTKPHFDGRLEKDEYKDGSRFAWNTSWVEAMPNAIESPEDLDFEGWVKHDGEYLYLAFDIRDDIFYGIDTERWLPPKYPFAHVIGERERGRPWFGDMIEILIYGCMMDLQVPTEDVTGDGRGVQIIYNLTKSLEGGVGVPGMLPHGPNRTVESYENNDRWIRDGIIESKTLLYPSENRYTVEIRLRLEGGIEIAEGEYWSLEKADTPIGFNLSIGDVDTVSKSSDGPLHHETWWAGKWSSGNGKPRVKFWGILVMTSSEKP